MAGKGRILVAFLHSLVPCVGVVNTGVRPAGWSL